MGKGRDIELIELRNAALCRRYIYLTEVQRMRPDDVLKWLSRAEFFLSEERLLKILRDMARRGELKDSPTPTVKKPKLTYKQLQLFVDDPDFIAQKLHRKSQTDS